MCLNIAMISIHLQFTGLLQSPLLCKATVITLGFVDLSVPCTSRLIVYSGRLEIKMFYVSSCVSSSVSSWKLFSQEQKKNMSYLVIFLVCGFFIIIIRLFPLAIHKTLKKKTSCSRNSRNLVYLE